MENQRVRLSKAMLKDALIQLLKTKPIEKITIYELCEHAQLNRTTFYKYYGNQYDLLYDIENDLFSQLEKYLLMGDEAEDGLKRALEFLIEQQEQCTVLINTVPDRDFSEKLFRLPVIDTMSKDHIPARYTDKQKEYIRLFILQGGYTIIRKWLNDENRESPEEIACLITSLFFTLLGEAGDTAR